MNPLKFYQKLESGKYKSDELVLDFLVTMGVYKPSLEEFNIWHRIIETEVDKRRVDRKR